MTLFQHVVQFALLLLAIYFIAGALFAIVFHIRGAEHLDHGITGAGIFFRVLITPAIIALWPLLVTKWRRANRGQDFAGASEEPVSAGGLRRLHGIFIQFLAVLLPLAFATALYSRPREKADAPAFAAIVPEPPSLPHVLGRPQALFTELPIDLQLRVDEAGARQVELKISRDLELPAVALYWSPDAQSNALPTSAVYLGSVWGPATHRYKLPQAASTGHLYLIVLGHDHRILATAPLASLVNHKS